MNKKDILSIAPYYGGKGRMAPFIVDRLNYDDSDIFVTPFGGMCRVLLNKPRHEVECYNDYSSGLTALMRILSDPVKAVEFIHRLEDETTYSEEEFNKQKAIFDNAENDLEEQTKNRIRQLLIDKKIVVPRNAKRLVEKILRQAVEADETEETKKNQNEITQAIKDGLKKLKEALEKDKKFSAVFEDYLADWIEAYRVKRDNGVLERSSDSGQYVSDMDLAIATYVVFSQSRDGMGKIWSGQKFNTNDQYKKRIVRLFDCAERLEGVEIFQIDAVDFFRRNMFVDIDTPLDKIPPEFRVLNEWINDPKVMMYCDPSYISKASEERLLEGIDVDNVDSLSEAIKEQYKGKKEPKNLGEIYSMSFNYEAQEKFLRCIQNARCRILVSNYDLQLYNKYLNESTGWRREEYYTNTAIGGKKDNRRLEVIWYNY